MLKPTVASMIALSIGITALACRPEEEPAPAEEETQEPDTTELLPPDSLVETIGGDWIVRAQSGKACVSVPPSAIPEGDTLDVAIKRVLPDPGSHPGVSEIYPPVYDFSVTDANGQPAQFADSVIFAICVNFPGPRTDTARLARLASAEEVEILPYAAVPAACHLTCVSPPAPASAAWLNELFRGSPITPTPAHAAVTEGLGGKGRTTSPFAGVEP